eukprot:m.137427 g.137427  ORF g.137427 m.137427 type:complete len:557 (-) comp13973_c0_seq2:2963-4633(-)
MSRRPSANAPQGQRKRPRPGPIDLSGGSDQRPDGLTPGGFLDSLVNGVTMLGDITPAGVMPHSAGGSARPATSGAPTGGGAQGWHGGLPQSPALALMSPILQQFLPGIFEANGAGEANGANGEGSSGQPQAGNVDGATPNEGALLKQLEQFANAFSSTMEKMSPLPQEGGADTSPVTPSRRSARQASKLSEVITSGATAAAGRTVSASSTVRSGPGPAQGGLPMRAASTGSFGTGFSGFPPRAAGGMGAPKGFGVFERGSASGGSGSLPPMGTFEAPTAPSALHRSSRASRSRLSTGPGPGGSGGVGPMNYSAGPSVSTMGMISQAMSQGRPFGLLTERRSSGGALMETPLSVGLGFGAFTPIDLGSDNLNRALGTLLETTAQSPGFRELQQTPTGVSRFTKALEEELRRKKIFNVPTQSRGGASSGSTRPKDSQEKASDPPPGLTTADLDESAMFTMISNGSEAPQFQCNSCDHITKRKSDAKKHYRKHTGEKPYACSTCSMRFSDPSTRSRHQKAHQSKSRHTCPVDQCGKLFVRKPQLKKHIEQEHPDWDEPF